MRRTLLLSALYILALLTMTGAYAVGIHAEDPAPVATVQTLPINSSP